MSSLRYCGFEALVSRLKPGAAGLDVIQRIATCAALLLCAAPIAPHSAFVAAAPDERGS